MGWFFLWLAAAASTAVGLSIAYLGPSAPPGGKGDANGLLLIGLPLPLMLAGVVGMVCSVAGIYLTYSRPAAVASAHRPTEIVAGAAFAVAMVALAGEIFFHLGIVILPGSYLGGPGMAGIIPFVGFAAWPVALAATLVSWLAMAVGSGRRPLALWGVILGSATLVWLPAWIVLGPLVGGGD
jgi:hypothetical protein